MKRGKQVCRILKDIRKQIADANDIEFVTADCQYKGDCLGTCPKCEAEVRYLEQQLSEKCALGKTVSLLGISLGLSILPAMASESKINELQVVEKPDTLVNTVQVADTLVEEEEPWEGEVIFGIVETMPEFQDGGMPGLMKFIKDNVRWPENAPECTQGRVTVQFTVNAEGLVINPKIIRSLGPEFDKEALRVVKLMGKWKPGTQRGKPVPMNYTIPVSFRMK